MTRQARSRWTSVKLHVAVVSITALSLYLLEDPPITLALGGILCFPTYLILGIMEGRRAPLWFSPLSFYFLWYSINLGLSAIYIASIIASGEGIPFVQGDVPPNNVAVAYVIYLGGSMALHIGLEIFRPVSPKGEEADVAVLGSNPLGALIILWAIGLGALYAPTWIAFLGAPGRCLQWASLASLSAFTLTPRRQFRLSQTAFTILLSVGTAGLFAGNLMSYSKAYLMLSFLPLTWLLIMRRHLRRWLPFLGLAFMMFYLAILAPIVTFARQIPLQEGESPAPHLIRTFQTRGTISADYIDSSSYSDQIDAFLMRQFDPIPIAYILGEVKQHGLQLGATMAYATYAFIPRIVWPDKPNVSRGAWFTTYIGFARSEEDATTSTGITAIGELYWNFGIPGVLVGMFTIGCLLGGLWQMAGADSRHNLLCMLLYVLIMVNMVNMAEAVAVFVFIASTFVTFKAAFIVLSVMRCSEKGPHVTVAS